jgi:hypothetical protein
MDYESLASEMLIAFEKAAHRAASEHYDHGLAAATEVLRSRLSALGQGEERDGAERIRIERERQKTVEGWTSEHDDDPGHSDGQMAQAAACYAWPAPRPLDVKRAWPWDRQWWKPTPWDRVRELEKAGALIAAEIDRLLRLEPADPASEKGEAKV